MKKLFGFLAALTLVVLCVFLLPTEAQAASESDLTFTLNADSASYSVTDCNESASGSLAIPATYNGKPVTSISTFAFSGCSSLTSITIPDSVTSIGSNAFYYCTSLTSITIPDSVTSIGNSAFYYCSSLTSITIPDSVTSIGNFVFRYCDRLTSITIPDSMTSIGDYAFSDCSSLTSITIPDSVTSIGGAAFRDCSSLTSITIPDGVTSIGERAFYYCSSLKSITIPDSVTSIGDHAFYKCSSLTSITIPDSVTSIGNYAFSGCSGLSKVIYSGTEKQWNAISIAAGNTSLTNAKRVYGNPCGDELVWTLDDNGLLTISGTGSMYDYGVFEYVSGDYLSAKELTGSKAPWMHLRDQIKKVVIGEGITSIGAAAFYQCTALNEVTIPSSLTQIGNGAFFECNALQNVYIGDLTAWCNITFVLSEKLHTIVIAPGWFDAIITTLYSNPISYAENVYVDGKLLTDLVIPQGVTAISADAFNGYERLTTVAIPASVVSIGKAAFDDCVNLTKVIYCGMQEQWNAVSKGDNCFPKNNMPVSYHNWTGGSCTVKHTCSACGAVGEMGHVWIDATCTNKKFCFVCGVTEGELGHTWINGSCTTPKTCSACGVTDGNVPGHSWVEATCTSAKICSVCEKIEGTSLGHSWLPATCTSPFTCQRCGATQGLPQHTWNTATCTEPKTCTLCGDTEGAAIGHSWVDATCQKEKHCSVCGLSEGTTIDHIYDNNLDAFCNVCNDKRIPYDANLQFYGTPGLSFQDYIGMQILIRNADVAKYDKVYVIAVQEGPNGAVETALDGIPFYGAYQVFNQQVLSWSMTELVTMTLYGEIGDVVYKGGSISGSVKSLAMEMLKTSSDPIKSQMLVDMLNYGTAVQTRFNYNPGKLANGELGSFAALGSANIPDFKAENRITGEAKVSVYADNISLQSKVEIQLLFTQDVSAYTAKAVLNGSAVDAVFDRDTYGAFGWTVLRVAVKAAHLRDFLTIALYDAAGNPVTQIYNVSAEGYANARLNSDMDAVYIAMMRYGDSVKAFANQ